MKKVLSLFCALWVFLVWAQSARAVSGVADEVPAQDLVVPIFCNEAGLNTLIAIAEVSGSASTLHYEIFNSQSQPLFDDDFDFTAWDVVATDCLSLINSMAPAQRQMMETEISGNTYYVGYVIFRDVAPVNNYVAWAYLVDLSKGLTTGFVPFHAEGGVNPLTLAENAGAVTVGRVNVGLAVTSYTNGVVWNNGAFAGADVTGLNDTTDGVVNGLDANVAFTFYPRWYKYNNDPDSFTWWIVLQGWRQCAVDRNGDSIAEDISNSHVGAIGLAGFFICDEEENCVSIPMANLDQDVVVVNVNDILPPVLCENTPCAGFGVVNIPALDCAAYANGDPYINVPSTILGWSYTRAKDATTQGSWSAMFPMHRN